MSNSDRFSRESHGGSRESHRDGSGDRYRNDRNDGDRYRNDRNNYDKKDREFDRKASSREWDRDRIPERERDRDQKQQEEDLSPDTIYISNLPTDITEQKLVAYFKTIGVIKRDRKTGGPKVWVYKNKVTGQPKGDATVTFEDPSAADGAINWFDGKVFEGSNNKIKVQKATAPKPPPGGWNSAPRGRGRGGRGGGGFRGRGGSSSGGRW